MFISKLSFEDRIKSIRQDVDYVRQFSNACDLPVVANKRCGSWYVPPDVLSGFCYFKSTDGHTGQWAFNHRRLNLHLLPLIERRGGCIVVDSTHGSKRFSDALSKTIPIWCAVINYLLFPLDEASHQVVLPPADILASEEVFAIRQKLLSIQESAHHLALDIPTLRAQLHQPLMPHFVENPDMVDQTLIHNNGMHTLVCLMASSNGSLHVGTPRALSKSLSSEMTSAYIRGAGDDEDNWAFGLQPSDLWLPYPPSTRLKVDGGRDYPGTAQRAMNHESRDSNQSAAVQIGNLPLYIGRNQDCRPGEILQAQTFDAMILCNEKPHMKPEVDVMADSSHHTKVLELKLREGKLGSRQLRSRLLLLLPFLSEIKGSYPSIIILDETGNDLVVGVCLAVLCLFYEQEKFSRVPLGRNFDKDFIRKQLVTIVSSKHDIDPSRTTLQSVHAFLMPKEGFASWMQGKGAGS